MPENRLAQEISPYLLQHKANPVDWYPWGPEAFEAAKASGRPVLLSVGYAACHWCHVMAHESFENEEIARLMNELFINIKVDREERPDIDTIYQSALALLGQQGGWPLTMFLTADGAPFTGGTYFPPDPRFGRPGFPQVLQTIAGAHAESPDKVAQNVSALQDALIKLSQNQGGDAIPLSLHDEVAGRLVREIDPFNGGIGRAPKFPNPTILKLLWRAWKRTKAEPHRNAVELTLTRMCQGGIYDHLGGGFARYAVDDRWLVPHFEKMLYDNAQLIDLLTWAWQDSGNPLYEARVRETVAWTLREMLADSDGSDRTPVAAFAASFDADSEGEEGLFYVWTEDEIDRLLGPDAEAFKAAYDVTAAGNWEGKTILNRSQKPELGDPDQEARLARSRVVLLEARKSRVWPGWDDKVLADWNGLMIAALANTAPVFGEPAWLGAAEAAFRFVLDEMTEDGRLRHSWRHGRARHPATLEDYANLCEAALALHEATGKKQYLDQVVSWITVLDAHYADRDAGGYFMTADDTEQLIVRTKSAHDNAVPSGNGTVAAVQARLFYLTGKDCYREQAEAVLTAFSGELERNFFPISTLLNANELLHTAQQIVVVGDRGQADTQAMLKTIYGVSIPDRILHVVESEGTLPENHPAHGKCQVDGRATAYLCRGMTCSMPITDLEELASALRG